MTLLDIPVMMDSLRGVVMELQDCALTLLKGQWQETQIIIFYTWYADHHSTLHPVL